MLLYSAVLLLVLVAGSPYWLLRMLTSGRYREGLSQRLGLVPERLCTAAAGRRVAWVHAVSVGEVLAATRLVAELETALGESWLVVVSTTTATGQALARTRFGSERVFFYPLDFGWAVRRYLDALQPCLLVLMEGEIWPRMLAECGARGVPTAVVNARVSDRSFRRTMKIRALWRPVLRQVSLLLTQSEEDARRLIAMGARADAVRVAGNLKYDVRTPHERRVAEQIRRIATGRSVIVAGSTVQEEELVMQAMRHVWETKPETLLVLAPRHPDRFAEARAIAGEGVITATELSKGEAPVTPVRTVLLDTIGDLAAVYALADAAFVGGSLVQRGGHNPLEPAQFGVPVVMGGSYENFREIVESMRSAEAIRLVESGAFGAELLRLLTDHEFAQAVGERGRQVFLSKAGATERVVQTLRELVP